MEPNEENGGSTSREEQEEVTGLNPPIDISNKTNKLTFADKKKI